MVDSDFDAAARAGLRRPHADADPHGRLQRLQQHRRPVLGGQRPAAGQDGQGRPRLRAGCILNTASASAGIFDLASEIGHQRGNEDFGQTFAVWGFRPGAVPVRPGVRADDGARRGRRPRAHRGGAGRHDTRRGAAQLALRRRRRRPARAGARAPARSSTPPRSTATSSSATPTCSGAGTWSTTASRRAKKRRTNRWPCSNVPRGGSGRSCCWPPRPRCRSRRRRVREEAPDALVKRVAQDVLATIKADPLIQAGNAGAHPRGDRDEAPAQLRLRADDGARDGQELAEPRRPSSRSGSPTSSGACSCGRTRARSTSTATRRSSTSRCG